VPDEVDGQRSGPGAGRVLKGYSGGMRRRLDLAAGIVTRPPVLFLDEPTTGLDPASRQAMWHVIRELAAGGTTVLLTTQYLDEADQLADRIVVIDHGRVIAGGTARSLKAQIGGARLDVSLTRPDPAAARVLAPFATGPVSLSADGRRLRAGVASTSGLATAIVRTLDQAGITVDDAEVRPPSLEDAWPMRHPVEAALLWSITLLAIFAPLRRPALPASHQQLTRRPGRPAGRRQTGPLCPMRHIVHPIVISNI
jgi:ABC-type multidrug transport system ATPase subunit